MAAYGQASRLGTSEADGVAYLDKLFANVPVQDDSARKALQTFTSGKGDVMLAYENEAIFARQKGQAIDDVVPADAILIENPVAVTASSEYPQPVLLEFDTEMEEAAASLGAGRLTTFRRVVLPNLAPAISAGTALALARASSEFGSTVLISGNLPFKTQVAAVHIFGQIEADNTTGAAAVATVLLVVALVVLVGLDLLQRWASRRA